MANQITSDNFLTQQPLKQQNFDADLRESPARRDSKTGTSGPLADDATALGRAEQRLSLETTATGGAISNAAEARQQAAALKDQIAAAPREALAAQGGIGKDGFEAAMAAPTT